MNGAIKVLKSDLVQVERPDEQEVASLVQKAKGKRTLKESADLTRISASTLSRIMNGKITRPLSLEIIVRIIWNSKKNTLHTCMTC